MGGCPNAQPHECPPRERAGGPDMHSLGPLDPASCALARREPGAPGVRVPALPACEVGGWGAALTVLLGGAWTQVRPRSGLRRPVHQLRGRFPARILGVGSGVGAGRARAPCVSVDCGVCARGVSVFGDCTYRHVFCVYLLRVWDVLCAVCSVSVRRVCRARGLVS